MSRKHERSPRQGGRDYEVGRGKPPRHTRWVTGQSGNPYGRPKKKKDLPALLDEALYRPITITENGRRRQIPLLQAFVEGLARSAVMGDPSARRDLLGLLRVYPSVVKPLQLIRMIDDSMTAEEASKAYAETLTAIRGVILPDDEIFG